MTVEEFQDRKAQLLAIYGASTQDAGRKRAQALARLYAESKFNERALAALEGMAQPHMHRWLVFGRFLHFLIPNGYQDYPYPERVFRTAWDSTDKGLQETIRFKAIAEAMQAAMHKESAMPHTQKSSRRAIARQLIDTFADGKWHPVATMAEAVSHDIPTVRAVMDRIVTHGTFQTFAESRPSAKGLCSYRLVKGGKKKIDLLVFMQEVGPLLDEMWTHATGHQVHYSQGKAESHVAQLKQLIERLAQ